MDFVKLGFLLKTSNSSDECNLAKIAFLDWLFNSSRNINNNEEEKRRLFSEIQQRLDEFNYGQTSQWRMSAEGKKAKKEIHELIDNYIKRFGDARWRLMSPVYGHEAIHIMTPIHGVSASKKRLEKKAFLDWLFGGKGNNKIIKSDLKNKKTNSLKNNNGINYNELSRIKDFHEVQKSFDEIEHLKTKPNNKIIKKLYQNTIKELEKKRINYMVNHGDAEWISTGPSMTSSKLVKEHLLSPDLKYYGDKPAGRAGLTAKSNVKHNKNVKPAIPAINDDPTKISRYNEIKRRMFTYENQPLKSRHSSEGRKYFLDTVKLIMEYTKDYGDAGFIDGDLYK